MRDAVATMKNSGTLYKGILYGQFMNTREGPKVIEFNARFGDPEAMNVLSLLSSDMTEIIAAIASSSLSGKQVEFERQATVCKYLVPEDILIRRPRPAGLPSVCPERHCSITQMLKNGTGSCLPQVREHLHLSGKARPLTMQKKSPSQPQPLFPARSGTGKISVPVLS
jgi:hypothetical protein